jgi:hypothetical protein
MRLTHNVITKGRYYKAGEEIPDEELSPNLLKYVVRDNGYAEEIRQQRSDADSMEWKPQSKLSSRNYVKRENVFKRVSSAETIPGEPLYKKDLNAPSPRFVRYGKVQSGASKAANPASEP